MVPRAASARQAVGAPVVVAAAEAGPMVGVTAAGAATLSLRGEVGLYKP